MKYVKLYEEFIHDQIYDVMMLICDTVPFSESTQFISTDRVRVYDIDEMVEFNPEDYEVNLDGWVIRQSDGEYKEQLGPNCKIVFIKGDLVSAGLDWLAKVFGDRDNPKIRPIEREGYVSYVDDDGYRLIYYYKKNQDRGDGDGEYFVNYERIWQLFEYFGMSEYEITELMRFWLKNTFGLYGLKPKTGAAAARPVWTTRVE